jgi:hypothetical protein
VKLIIVSDLVGTPGEEFVPAEGINVEALIEGGFIKQEKPTKEKSED